jgi:hypothetical protein
MKPTAPDVYHDRARLLKIDYWVRIFAWLYFGGAVLGLVAVVYDLATGFNRATATVPPDQITDTLRSWLKFLGAVGDIQAIFATIMELLLLLGISKAIRYLLALWETLQLRSVTHPSE